VLSIRREKKREPGLDRLFSASSRSVGSGSPAIVALVLGFRSVALRPRLSTGLPLSVSISLGLDPNRSLFHNVSYFDEGLSSPDNW
jgi:hypothetical protein